MQTPARPTCINDERCRDANRTTLARAFKNDGRRLFTDPFQPRLFKVDGAVRFGLALKRMIEIWPVPVSVADIVMWTSRYHQLAPVFLIVGERRTGVMKEEGEPPLEAAGNLWSGALPRSP